MTDRERAKEREDDTELIDYLTEGLHFAGSAPSVTIDTGHMWRVIGMATRWIRAYASEPVTPDGLREKVAKAIDDVSRVGWRFHYADEMELRNAGECANAALRAIHDGGFVLVPREPTAAMVEAMRARRMELINSPISRVYADLIRAAIAAAEKETGR